MSNNIHKIHFQRLSLSFKAGKILIWCAFLSGMLISLIFNHYEIVLIRSYSYALKSADCIFKNQFNPIILAKKLLSQNECEISFLLLALVCTYTVIPKATLSCLAALYGFQFTMTISFLLFSFAQQKALPHFITACFHVFIAIILIRFIYNLLQNRISGDSIQRNEAAIIVSAQTWTNIYSAMQTFGSVLLLNLINNILITLFSL